ncbi:hypothetical protein [Candidatus Enterococcus ferrettii]|uniref:Uncharacterized protein n=1 Tax=Candidatus Enterococcus ferrettii TaxID=2815324 RepID=A0ABV0EP60_9ENTE|nr:hypothetical protein [Enterococcus sp. 665A]MBO1340798.1 hypothetical protein [Enterococcus sp. 665A]
MDLGLLSANIIYMIFILMSIVYFYLFKRDRTFIHLYLSLIPTFICIFLLINYHYYQPAEGAQVIRILLATSIISCMIYWSVYALLHRKD